MADLANIGVQVVLAADPVGIVKGFAEADTAGKKFYATLNGITSAGKGVYAGLLGVVNQLEKSARHARNWGIGLGVSLAGATYGAIQFEAAMRNVGTIDQSVRDDFKGVSGQILNLSRLLPASGADIARAYYDVASSGFTGAQGVIVLEESLRGGIAGLASAAESGRALTAVLNAYGLSANKSREISDLLFQTVNLGVVTYGELTGVIGDSVGLAAAAGVPFRDVGTAIATMTRSGISAAEAGTSLNRLIQSLIQPSESLTEAWNKLSKVPLAEALKKQGLGAVMETLRQASQGNVQVLVEWFDEIRAARGAFALMANDGRTFISIQEQMKQAGGATQRALDEQMKSTSMTLKMLVNQFKSIGIEIGAALLPAVNSVAKLGTYMLGAWNILPGPIKALISYLGALSSAFLTIGGIMAVFALKSAVAGLAIRGIGSVILLSVQYLQRFGLATGILGTKIQALGTNMSTMSRHALSITRPIQGMVNAAASGFTFLGGQISRVNGPIGTLGGHFKTLGTRMRESVTLVPGLTAAFAALAIGAVIIGGQINEANNRADEFVKTITRKYDMDTYKGMNGALQEIDKKLVAAETSARGWGGHMRNLYDLTQGIKGGLVAAANIIPGFLGMGKVFGDPFGDLAKRNKLQAEYNKIIQQQQNLNANSQVVWQYLMNTNKDFAASQGNATAATEAAGKEQVVFQQLVSKAGKNLGIDVKNIATMTKPELEELQAQFMNIFGPSGGQKMFREAAKLIGLPIKAVKALANEVLNLKSNLVVGVDVLAEFGPAAMKVNKEVLKEVTKLKEQVGAQLLGGYDPMKAVTESGKAGADQFKYTAKLYTAQAQEFVEGLNALAMKGLNPQTLLQLASAGPTAALATVRVLRDDTTGELIGLANDVEKTLLDLQLRIANQAALVAKAVKFPTIAQDLKTALQIQDLAQYLGPKSSPEAIAFAMGLDPKEVRRIADEYSLQLGMGLSTGLQQAMDRVGPGYKKLIQDYIDWTVGATGVGQGQVEKVFEDLITKGPKAAKKAIEELPLTAEQKKAMMDIVDVASPKISKVGKDLEDLSKKNPKPTVGVKVEKDAEEKIMGVARALVTFEKMDVHAKMSVSGTTKAKEDLYDVDMKLDETGRKKAEPEVKAHTKNANENLDETAGKIDNVKNKSPVETHFKHPGADATIEKAKQVAEWVGKATGTVTVTYKYTPPEGQAGGPGSARGGNTFQRLIPLINAAGGIPRFQWEGGDIGSMYRPGDPGDHGNALNPAVDIGNARLGDDFLWRLYQLIMNNGPWKQVIWQAPGHYDHIHVAQRGGIFRPKDGVLFNEPGAGGEAYIPLNNGRPSRRSIHLLRQVANIFGYGWANGQSRGEYAQGGIVRSPNGQVGGGSSRNVVVQTNIEFSGPIAGKDEFRGIVHEVVDQRDRKLAINLARKGR